MKKFIIAILLITTILLTIIALTISPHDSANQNQVVTNITTGEAANPGAGQYGLLPLWQRAYNGSLDKTFSYDFDNDGTDETRQCANCHMMATQGSGSFSMKHEPPLHPIRFNATYGTWNYPEPTGSRNWFYDDNNHRGPNVELAYQEANIRPQGYRVVQCGDCHTAETPQYIATTNANATNDPHSVHRDVMNREGCIRCHIYENTTFTHTLSVGDISRTTTFTLGNATRSTYGIANPINMTRVWDGTFLSTPDEANYTYTPTGPGGKYVLNTSGTGWNRYGNTETSRAMQYGCGDCHDQFHAEQGLTGTSVEFSFNDSAGSRKGPYAPVNDNESYGINASGTLITCGQCHVTDAHAVHTNGYLNHKATYQQVNNSNDQSIINTSVLGAELCDECHSVNIQLPGPSAIHPYYPAAIGLGNTSSTDPANSHDRNPDLQSLHLGNDQETDCGFCHI